ncbi:MAG: hypothetical protein IKZ09_06720 [Clostridia bacterium]|nr:hypothetical protein [Clostridia bacterium]
MKKTLLVPEKYDDICRAIENGRRRILIKSAIWCAAVVVLEYVYLWQYFSDRIHIAASALIAVLLLISYPIKCGILKLLSDHGWEGQVRDTKKRSYIHFNRRGMGYRYTSMSTRIEGHLYLCCGEGRAPLLEKWLPIRKKFILRSGEDELPYQIGDTVRCYRGTAYPVIVRRPSLDTYPPRVCVFCGKTEEDRERLNCDFCGYALVTTDETVMEIEYGM